MRVEMRCDNCGALYDLNGDFREDGMCDQCGKPLLPEADADYFTARTVCEHCARSLLEQRKAGSS